MADDRDAGSGEDRYRLLTSNLEVGNADREVLLLEAAVLWEDLWWWAARDESGEARLCGLLPPKFRGGGVRGGSGPRGSCR